MSMRKWLRGMAHYNINKNNVKQANKPRKIGKNVYPSYFAVNWRDFIIAKEK